MTPTATFTYAGHSRWLAGLGAARHSGRRVRILAVGSSRAILVELIGGEAKPEPGGPFAHLELGEGRHYVDARELSAFCEAPGP